MVLRWISFMQQMKCGVKESTRFCLHGNFRKRGSVCADPLIYVSNKILIISCVYATRSVSMPDVSSISASEFCSIVFSLSITVSFTKPVFEQLPSGIIKLSPNSSPPSSIFPLPLRSIARNPSWFFTQAVFSAKLLWSVYISWWY